MVRRRQQAEGQAGCGWDRGEWEETGLQTGLAVPLDLVAVILQTGEREEGVRRQSTNRRTEQKNVFNSTARGNLGGGWKKDSLLSLVHNRK